MKVSLVQESKHASLQISDIEYHNFLKRFMVLITNCVFTLHILRFSKYHASRSWHDI